MDSLLIETETVQLEAEAIHPELCLTLGLHGSRKRLPGYPRVLSLLSLVLDKAVLKNESRLDSLQLKDSVTSFNGLRAPSLSLKTYLERIFKYSKCSASCFILAHIYMDRFLQQPDVHLTSLNVHRLLVTSVVVAAKFIDDAFFSNAYYARVGGVSTTEMNKLELDFLFRLDFRLSVSLATFEKYCIVLEKEASTYHIERPIRICGLKDQTNMEEKCPLALQTYSCGAV